MSQQSIPTSTAPDQPEPRVSATRVGPLASLVGRIGAWVIYSLIAILGRTHRWSEVPWLAGPFGRAVIGDAPYREAAAAEGLTVERRPRDGGLVPDFSALDGDGFDASKVHPKVRAFYEHTTEYSMDVWNQSHFPANIGLWLLVSTISRQVDQLNFPLSPLDTA